MSFAQRLTGKIITVIKFKNSTLLNPVKELYKIYGISAFSKNIIFAFFLLFYTIICSIFNC